MSTILLILGALFLIGLCSAAVDLSHLFPETASRGVAEAHPNTKAFTGNGQNILMLPGCRRVDSVRVGDVHLPAVLEEQYPMDGSEHPKMETVSLPLYQLIQTEDGPALQRSIKTNDGIWQSGVPVFVSGEWGDLPQAGESVPPAEPEPLPEFPNADTREELEKSLNRLNSDVCRRFAAEVFVLGNFDTKKEAITAILDHKFPA